MHRIVHCLQPARASIDGDVSLPGSTIGVSGRPSTTVSTTAVCVQLDAAARSLFASKGCITVEGSRALLKGATAVHYLETPALHPGAPVALKMLKKELQKGSAMKVRSRALHVFYRLTWSQNSVIERKQKCLEG